MIWSCSTTGKAWRCAVHVGPVKPPIGGFLSSLNLWKPKPHHWKGMSTLTACPLCRALHFPASRFWKKTQVCEVAPSAGPQQKSKIETGPSKAGECLTCLQMIRQKAEEAEQVHWVQCQAQEPADLDCFFWAKDLEQDRFPQSWSTANITTPLILGQ